LKLDQELEKKNKVEIIKEAARQKIEDKFAMKTQLAKYTTALRSGKNEKVEKRKDKKKKTNIFHQARRLESARKNMNHICNGNGGTFSNPGKTSIEEVSGFFVFVFLVRF
jgi:hypothetical protein